MRFFAAKAYDSHENANPLFPRFRTPTKLWPLICLAMSGAVVVTGVAALIYGPFLSIQRVNIEGAATLPVEDISAKITEQFWHKRLLVLPNSHQWFFDTRGAEAALMEAFPLESAHIVRQGATLNVRITEDIFMVALRSGDDVFFLDPNGTVLRLATPSEKATILVRLGEADAQAAGEGSMANLQIGMPVLQEKIATPHAEGDQLFDAQKIDNVLSFSQGLRTLGIQPKEFVSDDVTLPWFTVTSDQSYTILFDATKDVQEELAVLQAVLKEYFATQELPRYIDVRFGTRVYVR